MALSYAILGLLTDKPMSGYDLKKAFDESVNHFWAASLSQIYRELGMLHKKEYVRAEPVPQAGKPDKKVYSVTQAGGKALEKWLITFPEKLGKDTRDEFTLRIFLGVNIDNATWIVQFERFIKQKQEYAKALVAMRESAMQYTKGKPFFKNAPVLWEIVFRRAQITLDSQIAWARESIERLKDEGEK